VKPTTKAKIVALILLVASIVVVMTAASTAAWLPADLKAFSLVILLPATVALLLVVYFDWRAHLLRRTERDEHQEAA
jgi:hypothetical protein